MDAGRGGTTPMSSEPRVALLIETSNAYARGLLHGIRGKVNLLPLNEAAGIPFERPSDDRINRFAKILADHGVTVSVRKSRGRDIRAACGQLITETSRAEPAGRIGGGHGGELAMRAVKFDRLGDVDVADAVAIGEEEELFVLHMLAHAAQATTGHAVVAGVVRPLLRRARRGRPGPARARPAR